MKMQMQSSLDDESQETWRTQLTYEKSQENARNWCAGKHVMIGWVNDARFLNQSQSVVSQCQNNSGSLSTLKMKIALLW